MRFLKVQVHSVNNLLVRQLDYKENELMNKHSKAFWAAFWSGLAAPGILFANETPTIHRIEMNKTSLRDTLRGDWVKIGIDFGKVIAREEADIRSRNKLRTARSVGALARPVTPT